MKLQKRTSYIFILLLAAVMLAVVAAVLLLQPQKPLQERAIFQEEKTGRSFRTVYNDWSEDYTLFLPESAAKSRLRVRTRDSLVRISTGDGKTHWGSVDAVASGQKLVLTAYSLFGAETAELEVQYASGLPSLFLETESGTLEYLHGDKQNEAVCLAVLEDGAGEFLFSQACTVRGRGNSSWDNQAKRPYELDFDSGVSFGPFQDISRLCLLAEYADESKLHNSAAYHGAQLLEIPYSTGYTYLNMYIGGQYVGLYGAATKEEYRKDLDSGNIQAVFEVTSNLDKQNFHPALTRNPVRVLYGNAVTVKSAVDRMEEALLREDWESLAAVIDAESFAHKVVMEELFANSDMTYASQYFYLDRDGKIRCMLPWDYDLSLGYAFRYYNNKQVYEMESYKEPEGWYARLASFAPFREQVLAVLKSRCTPEFVKALQDHLAQTAQNIEDARETDLLRWEDAIPFNWFDRSCGEDTLDGMVRLYSNYFPQRIAFLTDHFENWEDYCLVAFDGVQYGNLCLPRGAALWDYLADAAILQGEKIDPAFAGWVTPDGLTPEDIDVVTEDILFQPRQAGRKQ